MSARVVAVLVLAGIGTAVAEPARPSSAVLVAEKAKQPSVAIAADGTIHVAMLAGGNLVVATSRDGGATYGEPVVAIDASGSARGGRQRGPRLGVDGAGRLVLTAFLTYDEKERAKKYPAYDLYLVTSADGAKTWTRPARVNEVEKEAPEGLHGLAVGPDGVGHVVWLDRRGRGESRAQDLWYARIEGGRVLPNRKIADGVCECCAPGIGVDGAGNPVVAWRQGGDAASREVFCVRSTDGGRTFTKADRVNHLETKEPG